MQLSLGATLTNSNSLSRPGATKALLDIGGRPETLGRGVVPLVESVSTAFKTNALFCASVVVMALYLLV